MQERALIYRSPPGSAAWHVVGVVSIGALLRQLDANIVSLLFPTLETTFHRPVSSVSWVAVTYRLTLATLVAVFGRLADLYGRKMLYTFGFLVFIAGSAVYQAWGQVTDRAPSRPPPAAPLVDEALRRPGPPLSSAISGWGWKCSRPPICASSCATSCSGSPPTSPALAPAVVPLAAPLPLPLLVDRPLLTESGVPQGSGGLVSRCRQDQAASGTHLATRLSTTRTARPGRVEDRRR